jgi:diguanylate cyclase (GGDEF)-like protein
VSFPESILNPTPSRPPQRAPSPPAAAAAATRLAALPLSRLLALLGALLLVPTLLLIGGAARHVAASAVQTQAGIEALEAYRLALRATEMASRERGPTNALLGDGLPADPARKTALEGARQRTDQAFAALMAQLAQGPQGAPVSGGADPFATALQSLAAARIEVDRTAALPPSQRSADDIRHAVGAMIAVIPHLWQPLTELAQRAEAGDPGLGDALTGARLAGELREYAGQLGSQFTAPLAHGLRFTDAERMRIEQIRGRIEQLHALLDIHLQARPLNEALGGARSAMETRYFGQAQALLNAILVAGQAGAPDAGAPRYGVDPAGFAARYVPQMDAILAVRDALLLDARALAQDDMQQARQTLLALLACSGALVVALGFSAWVLRQRVMRPLNETRDIIVALAQGQLSRTVPQAKADDEIGDVLDALQVLRDNSVERARLAGERDMLIERLREQSATDFLTGLPNRRAFFEAAEREQANAVRWGQPFAVLLLDIDHFKRINDTHGHATGDDCLRTIGQRARSLLRQGDLIARIGGEEFAILLPRCGSASARANAERLRRHIGGSPILLGPNAALHLTASIGVAAQRGVDEPVERLLQRADAAMYSAKNAGRNRVAVAEDLGDGAIADADYVSP